MKLITICVPTIAMFAIISPASASVLYGVSASGQADYMLPSTAGSTTGPANSYTTGAFLQEMSYNQAANYGSAGSTTVGASTYSASAYVGTQTASYGQLHESVQASASGPTASASATASAYIAWLDTITFAGAPVGTSVVVQLINVYDGSFTISGATDPATSVAVSAELLNQSGNVTLTNKYTTSSPAINVNQSGVMDTTVGATLTLQESITEFISGSETFSGTADFANTSAVYLKVLTPGVTIVSASGADYTVPSSVTPEPVSAFLLVAGGIAAFGAVRTRRTN